MHAFDEAYRWGIQVAVIRAKGYWRFVIPLMLLGAGLVYFRGWGQRFDPSPWHRVSIVLLIGMALLLLEGPMIALWDRIGRNAGSRKGDATRRGERAKISDSGQFADDLAVRRYADLKLALRERSGWRWRSSLPWLLVCGEASAVDAAAPGLPQAYWQITQGAVLLHGGAPGALDDTWLRAIRRSRWRRPIDAVAAIIDAPASSARGADTDALSHGLFRRARALGWSAPLYLLNLVEVERGATSSAQQEPIAFLWTDRAINRDTVQDALDALSARLAETGVVRLARDIGDSDLAKVSRQVAQRAEGLADFIARLSIGRNWKSAPQGLLFAGARFPSGMRASASAGVERASIWSGEARAETSWQAIAEHGALVPGRAMGFSWYSAAAFAMAGFFALWGTGIVVSGIANAALIAGAAGASDAIRDARSPNAEANALRGFQADMDTLEQRELHGAPWYSRFGLNRDHRLLASLWPIYDRTAARIVVAPARSALEDRLRRLGTATDQAIEGGGQNAVDGAYRTLKAYLMMARPDHADAAFLIPQLLALDTPRQNGLVMLPGAWRDLREQLIGFYARHLRATTADGCASPLLQADPFLVASARQTLIKVIGLQNSTDQLYGEIIGGNAAKYPATSLQALLGGTVAQGLFTTDQTLPGIYTRAAWDERIGKAIDDADEERTSGGDWVLTDTHSALPPAGSMRTALRQRYFADFARAWGQLLNSIRWQDSMTMSSAADQLTLLSDPQRSPLQTLMNVITYQAQTGVAQQSLGDNLVSKAQQYLGNQEKDPSRLAVQGATDPAPLADAFGPLLRLAGNGPAGPASQAQGPMAATGAAVGNGDVSLARYLQSVTAVRLKLQQIMTSQDPGDAARVASQAILQGKASELADARSYSDLVAASLGAQWNGFAEALFRRPIGQTWGMVLQPAAASLNENWRDTVASAWNTSFDGRYPFSDSDDDASLPEIGRFVRPDSGVIAQFVTSQLAGVIERRGDRWIAVGGTTNGSLAVDPAFLDALNRLANFGNLVFPNGNAQVRYELRAVPTIGLSELTLKLSDSTFRYVNEKQDWSPFVWPGESADGGTWAQWRTVDGGLKSGFAFSGRFGLIRMLERADISQLDGARYLLKWPADASLGSPLQLEMRTEAGAGPLEVRTLRHFALPSRIFLVTGGPTGPKAAR